MPEHVDEQLRHFVLAKQEVASALHSVKQWLETSGTEESKQLAQNLLVKLASRPRAACRRAHRTRADLTFRS